MNKLLYIFVFLCSTLGIAQTKIAVATDTHSVFIGDIINVDLYVQSTQSLIWPDLEKLIAPVEIQAYGKIDTSKLENTSLYRLRIAVQSFDTGRFVLPRFPFSSLQGDTFFSDSIAISFLAVPLDTTNAIFDIKQPREVPFNFAEAKPYIWSTFGLLLLLVLIYFLVKRFSNKKEESITEIILIPCEIEAKEALEKLQTQEYLQKGAIKTHYVELTEILRHYFDREFEIDTLESTTDETINLLKAAQLDKDLIAKIEGLLVEADLVKFAKSTPDARTSNNYMSQSYMIVENCHAMKTEVSDV